MSTDIVVEGKAGQREITPLQLIQDALKANVPPETLKELVALQQSMVRFGWEQEERQSRIDFDVALNACQRQIERVVPNQKRENSIEWADYVKLDSVVRPVYLEQGFSVGFSEMDAPDANRLRMRATVSRGGVSREYFAEISRQAPNSKMGQADADASAASRVKRYLIIDIFNIAIGVDKLEKGAFTPEQGDQLADLIKQMEKAATLAEEKEAYGKAFSLVRETGNKEATVRVIELFEKRKKELSK